MLENGQRFFGGAFKVVSDWYESDKLVWKDELKEKRKIYPYEIKVQPLQIGKAILNSVLISRLNFIKNKKNFGLYLRSHNKGPANFGRPISEQDSQILLQELGYKNHERIVEILYNIGQILNFYPKRNYRSPDEVYEYDLAWFDSKTSPSPIKIFEVQYHGQLDVALKRLEHANTYWIGCQLFLITSKKKDAERAKKAAHPSIKDKLQILMFDDIINLDKQISECKELLQKLSSRKPI